jgi:replicative DNA helicase
MIFSARCGAGRVLRAEVPGRGNLLVDFQTSSSDTRGVPSNVEAERSVLGALLLHPDAVGDVSQLLKPDDFYSPRHRVIFQAIVQCFDANSTADLILVEEALKKNGHLDEAGGQDTLLDLAASVVSAAGVNYHAEIVREKSILRKLLETTLDISRMAYESGGDAKTLLDEAERRIFEIARVSMNTDIKDIGDILQDTFNRIELLRERAGRLTGLETGYHDLDDMMSGLQGGELLILAARPSMGKTSLALNLTERVAGRGNGVVLFSLEMSSQQIIQNMLCARSQIDGQAMRKGRITDAQMRRLQEEAANLYESDLFVDDSAGLTVTALRAKCRRLKSRHDIKMVVVDYLQLLTAGGRVESRQQEISTISRSLKSLARELDVPVIALSQLNRDVESRDDHRPRMSDLRESGAIEQDADVIMLLHREEYFNPTEDNAGLAQLIIAKQRNGPTGEVTLRFFRNFMRFENFQRRSEPIT